MGLLPITEIDENGRVCTVCGVYKLWSEYHKNKTQRSGYATACKDCKNKINKKVAKSKSIAYGFLPEDYTFGY
jgi:hypothetical protein